ncbi:MAG: NAD(P)H-hydrate dehydratase [Thermodesulfobacteriota bacterium]|nr:NAD(P)H-hydrate dehydratase [Thermodesulfobacteriota bacterium]
MMLICGTVPIKDFPLTLGEVKTKEESLIINDLEIPCTQGTVALISAALATTEHLNITPPQALIVGDNGEGKGSRLLYDYLIKNISAISPSVLVLHYCLPVMELMKRLCGAVEKCPKKPIMIADASSMYAAKAAGLAAKFDIFTPDSCEMAFLADPDATHPAYIGRHLFDTDITQAVELITDAYRNKSAARLLLIKGAIDYVVKNGEILDTIVEPDLPELEAIGGTGDTITGMVSAFTYAELELHEAAIIAARANRMAGKYAQATPATRIPEIISQLPAVFKDHLCEWSGVCMV